MTHGAAQVTDQMANGMMANVPAGAVMGLAMVTEPKMLELGTSQYNRRIHLRMARIE